jgi:hypothetical protein
MVNELQEHAQYSPSSLELLELCPCFAPDFSRDDSAAKDGTRLHKAVEVNDLSLCNDEEEEEAVTRCLTYEDQVLEEMGEGSEIHKEMRLLIEDLTRGTGDDVIVNKDRAAIIDWKFGRQPVTDAEDNIQMQGYVLGVFTAFPNVDTVDVHIVGPRMDFLSTATYKRSDCDKIRQRILNIIEKCEDPSKSETPNEKCCRWCGRKGECEAIASTALAVGRNLGLPMPIEFEPGRMIRPEDRAKAHVLSYILEDWCKKVREYNVKAAIEDGINIPGFEIRSRKGSTTVVDVHKAVDLAQHEMKELSLPMEGILQACSMSIPKLVEQMYAKAQVEDIKVTKKAIREQVNTLLKEVVSESDTVTFLQRNKGKTNEDILEECG